MRKLTLCSLGLVHKQPLSQLAALSTQDYRFEKQEPTHAAIALSSRLIVLIDECSSLSTFLMISFLSSLALALCAPRSAWSCIIHTPGVCRIWHLAWVGRYAVSVSASVRENVLCEHIRDSVSVSAGMHFVGRFRSPPFSPPSATVWQRCQLGPQQISNK